MIEIAVEHVFERRQEFQQVLCALSNAARHLQHWQD